MQRIIEPLPPFNGAPTAGTSPILNVPFAGRSFSWIALRVIGSGPSSAVLDVRSVIDSVEVLVDSQPVNTYKPKLWRQFTEYFNVTGDTPAVDYMLIPFASPGVRGSEWGTRGMKSLQVKVNVVAALPASTTFTDINAHAEYFLEDAPRGEYLVHKVITPKMTQDGENVFTDFDFGDMTKVRRLFFFCMPATADLAQTGAINANTAISRSRIKIGNLPVWDSKLQDVNFMSAHSPLVKIPATQYGHLVDLDKNLDPDDWQIIKVGDRKLPVEVRIDWGNSITATQMVCLVEGVEGAKQVAA